MLTDQRKLDFDCKPAWNFYPNGAKKTQEVQRVSFQVRQSTGVSHLQMKRL